MTRAKNNFDLNTLNAKFERASPETIIEWAIREFSPDIAMTSSFQTESVVLLHMVSRIDPNFKVFFLETGWHFQETLDFKGMIQRKFGLTNIVELRADQNRKRDFDALHGGKPYLKDPDACCQLNKVEPLERALEGLRGWVSGIRRSQSKTRSDIEIVEEFKGDLFKINPMANMTSGDIWWYIKQHKLPKHALFEKGYLSIGCWPCTKPVQPGDDERSGRWAGTNKTECGIHTFLKPKQEKPAEEDTKAEKDEGSDI